MIAEPQRIGCLAGSRRATDKVDQVMLHGMLSLVPFRNTSRTPMLADSIGTGLHILSNPALGNISGEASGNKSCEAVRCRVYTRR